MKPLRTITAVLALAATLAATAQTAPSAPASPMAPGASAMHGHGHSHGRMDPAQMQQRHEQRMNALKQSLQLAPAQEAAWTQFATAMRPPQSMPHRPDPAAMAKMTTPERIDQMRAMRQQHQAEMDRRADATKAFYATLTPEQKQRFDDHTARMMSGGMHSAHGHGSHGHHGATQGGEHKH